MMEKWTVSEMEGTKMSQPESTLLLQCFHQVGFCEYCSQFRVSWIWCQQKLSNRNCLCFETLSFCFQVTGRVMVATHSLHWKNFACSIIAKTELTSHSVSVGEESGNALLMGNVFQVQKFVTGTTKGATASTVQMKTAFFAITFGSVHQVPSKCQVCAHGTEDSFLASVSEHRQASCS